MSGAEALAVIGIISNILQLVDFGCKAYDRIKDLTGEANDIPKAFRESRSKLELVSPVLEKCQTNLAELRIVFEKVVPAEGASKMTRRWKAISSLRQDKRVKALMISISDYVQILTYYHTTRSATDAQVASIKEDISKLTTNATALRKPCFVVRYQKDKDFVGRQDIMEEIEQRFQVEDRVAIAGIGGVGKSRIAIEYCYKYKESHPDAHVFWVHCGNKTRFEAEYRDIARELELPGHDSPQTNILQKLSDWLSDIDHGSWLMVLDNADDTEIWTEPVRQGPESPPLAIFIPRGSHGLVLITTRDSQLGGKLTDPRQKPIHVLAFRPEDAEALLRNKLSDDRELGQEDANEMTKTLDYLPLAITQASAFLNQNDMTVAHYLRLLRAGQAHTMNILERGIYDMGRDHDIQNSVFQTWKLSFDQVSSQAPRASDILSLMAMFDRQSLPANLLHSDGETEFNFTVAIKKLKAFSLITEESDGRHFSIHRLVQFSIQRWLEHKNELLKWQESALAALCKNCPLDDYFLDWTLLGALRPHVQIVLGYQFSTAKSHLELATIRCVMGSYARTQGQHATAFQYQSESLRLRKENLGPQHPDTLTSLDRLAFTMTIQCKYDDAHNMYCGVLELRKQVLGPEHPDALKSMSGLGNVLRCQRRFTEAEKLLQKTLELQSKVLGPDDLYTGLTMKYLATVIGQLRRYREAEELLQQVLQLYTTKLDPYSPYTLSAMRDVALIQGVQNKFSESERKLRESLEKQEKVLGYEHLETLDSRMTLALILSWQKKYEEAEQIKKQVLKLHEMHLGREHPKTLRSMTEVAHVLFQHRKFTESEAMWRKKLEISETSLGTKHIDTLQALYDLTLALSIAGSPNEALERRLLESREEVLGPEHPDTLISMANLVSTLKKEGKTDEASQLDQRLLVAGRRNSPQD